MWDCFRFLQRNGAWALGVTLLTAGCGSSSDAGGDSVLTQAPHCTAPDILKIEGTIAGGTLDDTRTTNINAGYENIGMSKFYTPLATIQPLASNQLALTITWQNSLFDGASAAATGGTLTLPANHPTPGAQYCISAGRVGFVSGGDEDGAFKFAVTEVKAGADCSGPATAVDIRGCYQ